MYTALGAPPELKLLPPCYSQALHECIAEPPISYRLPHCKQINAAYDRTEADFDAMDATVDSLPFCDPPGFDEKLLWSGIGALGGVLVAGLIGSILR